MKIIKGYNADISYYSQRGFFSFTPRYFKYSKSIKDINKLRPGVAATAVHQDGQPISVVYITKIMNSEDDNNIEELLDPDSHLRRILYKRRYLPIMQKAYTKYLNLLKSGKVNKNNINSAGLIFPSNKYPHYSFCPDRFKYMAKCRDSFKH